MLATNSWGSQSGWSSTGIRFSRLFQEFHLFCHWLRSPNCPGGFKLALLSKYHFFELFKEESSRSTSLERSSEVTMNLQSVGRGRHDHFLSRGQGNSKQTCPSTRKKIYGHGPKCFDRKGDMWVTKHYESFFTPRNKQALARVGTVFL